MEVNYMRVRYAQVFKRVNKNGDIRYGFYHVVPDKEFKLRDRNCDLKTVAGVKRVIAKRGLELLTDEILEV